MTIDLTRRTLCCAIAASPIVALAGKARAADAWPTRPIKWVVPYIVGSSPDTSARILAEAVAPLLGQPIIVENRGGAAGNIGARLVANAAPDGYTWVYSAGPMAASMVMYKAPGYDALKDFRHVMQLTHSDVLLIVNPSSGIKSLEELVARARANPGKLYYASGGVGTPSHLGVELFMKSAGIQATHVPYKGASELVHAVMSNQVTFGMPIFSVAYPQVQAGKLTALAVAGKERNAALPEVQTLAEQGMDDVELSSWGGLSLPAGTPDSIANRIHAVFAKALNDPSVTSALTALGSKGNPSTSEEYVQTFKREISFTREMMDMAGLEPM